MIPPAQLDPRRHDKALHDLVGELSTRSEKFRRRWGSHNVRTHGTGTKGLAWFAHISMCREASRRSVALPAHPISRSRPSSSGGRHVGHGGPHVGAGSAPVREQEAARDEEGESGISIGTRHELLVLQARLVSDDDRRTGVVDE
jgi:MmyB-like transcription regulator ligand binding domain